MVDQIEMKGEACGNGRRCMNADLRKAFELWGGGDE